MAEPDDATRAETLAKLAQSRAEIRRVLEPAPPRAHHSGPHESHIDETVGGAFPRSRTMKLLMSGRGLGAVGAVVGGLALARPALFFRLLRVLPTGAVARMLVVKAVTALRNRRE
jgi:hypothetical protein